VDLGGGLLKQRVAREGAGKSGGYLRQSFDLHQPVNLMLRKGQIFLCRFPELRQLLRIQIRLITLGKAKRENGALARPEKYQRPVSDGDEDL
jgi:hypothetical protein